MSTMVTQQQLENYDYDASRDHYLKDGQRFRLACFSMGNRHRYLVLYPVGSETKASHATPVS